MALLGASNEEKIWNYLKACGLNDYGVAGCMGNLYAESALKPNNLQSTYEKKLGYTDSEYVAAVDSGKYTDFVEDSAGFGLAQWTHHTRKQSLLNFAKSKNKSIGDLETQLDFLMYELSGSYKDVLNVLKTAKSVMEASDAMLLKFERPANQGTAVRVMRAAYGQKYYTQYAVQTAQPIKGGAKMKYDASNKPLVCMMTQNACYKGTTKMKPVGVLWHSTGANNVKLSRYVQPDDNAANRKEMIDLIGVNKYKNDANHSKKKTGVNCWIGKLADGTITTIQTMPWDYRPWGCGKGKKGSCNDGFIQFEICEDNLADASYFKKVYQEACEITAYLCELYEINPYGYTMLNEVKVPNILCHADSHALGLGTNHGDVYHWFKKHGKTMDSVRSDVAKLMGLPDKPDLGDFKPYKVRVAANALKIRAGAGTNYDSVGVIRDKGVYTIVDESDGKGADKWGKLKSGQGWISLDYTNRLE